ncbi:Nitrous oxide reductase maturation protein NosR [Bathymodiolus heckerae thiotrophic gill symbiont]|uniref:NosR/NirI family protein n=1 Tax=Bathymodiolus heckerae thiotrophic gill symbiont TaxID=1052212 RepID=UPI0010BAB913|nr:NosR/NirI family protein [Bathymodiolus heckerae thiotrophic gill symbiont]SMN13332.1 Nitrous oxide reductase maturation protein NosR [Bathymodiolus heckerae thiotrophic gill symbiont]SMN15577.1 Nitrous oxide reductase maturation protein NosR [uncultured Candidatus Thioglobus sp.]
MWIKKSVFTLFILWSFITYGGTQLDKFEDKIDLSIVYPSASIVKKMDGISALRIFQNQEPIGYVIINTDFNETIGYSGKPIHVAIGIDNDSQIQGVQLLKHSEPIVLTGIPEKKLISTFIRYKNFNVVKTWLKDQFDSRKIDAVSGATVTDRVIDDSVLHAVLKFSKEINLASLADKLSNDKTGKIKKDLIIQKKSWQQLLSSGAISNSTISVGDVSEKYLKNGYSAAAKIVESDNPKDTFINLNLALVSVEEIGQNILGKAEYKNLTKKISGDQHAILVMAKGLYSFRGTGFVRGGLFDRFTVEQGANIYRFRDMQYKRLAKSHAEKSPKFSEIGLFRLPEKSSFDPSATWKFSLLVNRAINVDEKRFYNHILRYQLPERYYEKNKIQDNAGSKKSNLIKNIWESKKVDIIILMIALATLTIIFFAQDRLTTSARKTVIVRNSFLVFTMVWIGFISNDQLSVVNVLTFMHVLMDKFTWDFFLLDPLVFISWASLTAILILWGRGVYCGWLCPFGALQELLNKVAKYFKVPQVKLPWWLHERLWAIKYLVFLGLLGISLYSLELAEYFSEVEPFKTSIILNFNRTWPFVVYALVLLFIGLFIERFYCRYLCPLGAALAIPAKLRIFNWLKRYPKDCGTPCQTCANECMVDAIHPEGNINDNECMQCMHCQVLYHDQHKCPAKVKEVKRDLRHKDQRKKSEQRKKIELDNP